jgi:hypothetical protein
MPLALPGRYLAGFQSLDDGFAIVVFRQVPVPDPLGENR